MASSTSTSTTSSSTEARTPISPQAGPLPLKRGELGFQERSDGEVEITRTYVEIAERHPADRDAPSATNRELTDDPSPGPVTHLPASTGDTNSIHSMRKNRLVAFLSSNRIPAYGGLRLTTILAFLGQIVILGGTIAGWALAVQTINRDNSGSASGGVDGNGLTGTSYIFIHALFGLFILAQLIFLERRVFHLRAERYSFKHPGEMLPSSRQRFSPSDSIIGLAPWHRPPLPTYAAALAQSGTGDVEDNVIATPPPPAYGNTRGSTLLLAGYLRTSLRAQRPQSQRSQASNIEERPVSYASRDGQWEEIRDADRARRLEATLSRLERPSGVSITGV